VDAVADTDADATTQGSTSVANTRSHTGEEEDAIVCCFGLKSVERLKLLDLAFGQQTMAEREARAVLLGWGPGWGVASVDPRCLAALTYAKMTANAVDFREWNHVPITVECVQDEHLALLH
jgi:hypothetical protein